MAKNPCKYLIEIAKGEFKEFTEPELKDYLLNQDLYKCTLQYFASKKLNIYSV